MNQDWAGLPKHLLDSILERFELFIDFLRFGAVCVWWHSISMDNQTKPNKLSRHNQVPMLLVPSEQEHTWDIYNVLDEKILKLKLSLLYNKRFGGSSQGWLVVANKDCTVTLHRPYFILNGDISDENTSVQLPCLFPQEYYDPVSDPPLEDFDEEELNVVEGYEFHVRKALITADPLTNPKDCTIVVIYGQYYKLAWMRYGKDTTWRNIADEYRRFADMVHYKNKFYFVFKSGKLVSFDPCNGTIKDVAPKIVDALPSTLRIYLVELYGELLLVERYIHLYAYGHDRATKMFRVSKFDFDGARWIEIQSLGDAALFVGDNSVISVLASNFDGLLANCIYFTHDEVGLRTKTDTSCDLGVYSLKSKSFKLYYNNLDSSTFHRMFKRPPIWIVPLPDVC